MSRGASPARATLMRNGADWLPAARVTGGVALAALPLVVPMPVPAIAAVWLVALVARAVAPVHQHCHAHYALFARGWANAAYDLVLALAAGNVTAVWELQHVAGHHRHYLTPADDPAACGRFGDNRVAFTVLGDALSFADSRRVARGLGRSTARLWRQQLAYLAVLGALIAVSPVLAIAMFVVPAVMLRWAVFWISWEQHHGAPLHDVYSSSITHFRATNGFFLNVGHHTAHHEKPTLHWTALPARTERILDRIPAACLR